MTSPIVLGGQVMWAPPPPRLIDRVHPGLYLGGSWQPYGQRRRFDLELDCRTFPDDDTTPPNLAELVESVAAAVRNGQRTLVRCHLGLNRSALVAGLALRQLTNRTGVQIIRSMRAVRSPHVLCNPAFAQVVHHAGGDGWTACTAGHRHWGRFGAAGLLLTAAGRVLLQRRAPWSQHGGTWGLPGGARRAGESAAAAALRETTEEVGVPADAVRLLRVELSTTCGGWRYVTLLGQAGEPLPVRGSPEGDPRWVPAGEVSTLPLHPGLAATWPRLLQLLESTAGADRR